MTANNMPDFFVLIWVWISVSFWISPVPALIALPCSWVLYKYINSTENVPMRFGAYDGGADILEERKKPFYEKFWFISIFTTILAYLGKPAYEIIILIPYGWIATILGIAAAVEILLHVIHVKKMKYTESVLKQLYHPEHKERNEKEKKEREEREKNEGKNPPSPAN